MTPSRTTVLRFRFPLRPGELISPSGSLDMTGSGTPSCVGVGGSSGSSSSFSLTLGASVRTPDPAGGGCDSRGDLLCGFSICSSIADPCSKSPVAITTSRGVCDPSLALLAGERAKTGPLTPADLRRLLSKVDESSSTAGMVSMMIGGRICVSVAADLTTAMDAVAASNNADASSRKGAAPGLGDERSMPDLLLTKSAMPLTTDSCLPTGVSSRRLADMAGVGDAIARLVFLGRDDKGDAADRRAPSTELCGGVRRRPLRDRKIESGA